MISVSMKKLFSFLIIIFAFINLSFAQIITYDIPITSFNGMTINTGDFCFDPNEYKQSAAGNTWGFTWTSIETNTPSTISIQIRYTINDATGPHPTTLNGISNLSINPSFAACSNDLNTFNLDPTNYISGGLNTFFIDYSTSPQRNQISSNFSTIFAQVIVDYSTLTVTENNISDEISIYPNPSKGKINIKLGSLTDVSVKISNILGQTVYFKNNLNINTHQINLNEESGIYFVEVVSNGRKYIYKLLIL